MTPTRRQVGLALHQLLSDAKWDNPSRGFTYTAERLMHWDEVPSQPAMMTQEGDERVTQTTRGLAIRIWEYRVLVYQNTGLDAHNPRPADESDLIMDALDDLMPSDDPDQLQTLDGLVHSVKIVGTVLKDDGALDGQGTIIIPIEVTVP